MWWLAGPQDVYRIEDRISTIYVERCHIDRDENAIVFVNKEKTIRLPVAMVAAVLLGPGTRITHAAMALLGNSGTTICCVGEMGVRFYCQGYGPSRGSRLLSRQAYLVSRQKERLAVARAMYRMRFPNEDVSTMTMQQLRGREGARIKKIYAENSRRTNVKWDSRLYKHGAPFEVGDPINRLLSAAHSCLYGICHAAIVGIGMSPGLGFVHTGNSISFVLDISDLYKAETTIPLAFDLASQGLFDERDIRIGFRDKISSNKFMARIVNDIKNLMDEGEKVIDKEESTLWDETVGPVTAGINWDTELNKGNFTDDSVIGISGPIID